MKDPRYENGKGNTVTNPPTAPCRRFWPVIHVRDRAQVERNIAIAADVGAHGVFLINMESGPAHLVSLIGTLDPLPVALGVNVLGVNNYAAADIARDVYAAAYWTDHVDAQWSRTGLPSPDGPDWFGGVAHKGNPWISTGRLAAVSAGAAAHGITVPTMTGTGTGQAADPDRVEAFHTGLPDGHRLGLASGITPGNVDTVLPYVTDYLAATGISRDFHNLDADLTRDLADRINQ